jgi:hypothetical protein
MPFNILKDLYRVIEKFLYIGKTYLITPWSSVPREELTASLLVKKFPAFYGTQKFMTAFTNACKLSIS